MRRIAAISVLALVLCTLSGCGITGTWKLESVQPEAARIPFASVTFKADGTYTAEATEKTGSAASDGAYTFNNKILTITPKKGESRQYDAELTGMNCKLRMTSQYKGQTVTAVMKRQ